MIIKCPKCGKVIGTLNNESATNYFFEKAMVCEKCQTYFNVKLNSDNKIEYS